MAITFVINPGSSSKKFALYDTDREVFSAKFERTVEGFERCVEVAGERQLVEHITLETFEDATSETVRLALEHRVIATEADITIVGIRVVAPGTYFQTHKIIGPEYIAKLQNRSPLAPLHTPMLLREIAAAREALPDHMIVGVSDSAFHSTKPPVACRYSISDTDAKELDLFRYGYHGLSVSSIARRLETQFGHVPARTIVAHVGSGVSLTALQAGVSIDTTMGYSPESGLIMSTRSGDLDAGAMLALMHERNLRPFDAHVFLSTRGGMKGMLGNGDLRFALERRSQGDPAATLALEQFSYQIKKTIGAYYAVLGGLDAFVVTATAAFRNPDIRTLLLANLEHLGIRVATGRNQDLVGREGMIHGNDTPVAIAVMRTDEMGEIARATERFL